MKMQWQFISFSSRNTINENITMENAILKKTGDPLIITKDT